MKQTKEPQTTKKSIPKGTVVSAGKVSVKKQQIAKQKSAKAVKYKMDYIKKDNFDTMHLKFNITEIKELQIKYVLSCIEGIFKNRFLYITTHKEGQIFGSGQAKQYGLTLQIEGAGLSAKHAQLKFDGFKNFDVLDFGSESGTWMNIPKEGVQVKDGEQFSIGPFVVSFTFAEPLNEIEQICMVYHIPYLSDLLEYNGIKNMNQLFAAEYNKFKDYPFEQKDIEKLERICSDSKKWYVQSKNYRRINANFLNEPLKDLSIQIGWESYYFSNDPDFIFSSKKTIAEICRGKLLPNQKVFSRIQTGKSFPLALKSQLKIGNLLFQLKRFNSGVGEDIGFRPTMEDGYIIEEDIGGSEWKLISLFAVFDGHGGSQCMEYMKNNLVEKIKSWTNLLDEAGEINEMLKILMNKTFFELDYEFYQKYPQIGMTCGATALILLIIESKVYAFAIGDCKGYLFRNDVLYQLNLQHLPSRGDERIRIENAGGFIQYDRLMGKCTLSRCFGQFQYKNLQDYQNNMKGKLKSCLSCIPDVISFDMNPSTDDFMLISTDGIFQAMSISEVVEIDVYRLISSMKNTLNWRQKRVQTRLSALLFRIARYYRPNVTTCQPFYLLLEKVWLEHLKLGDFIYFISSIRYHKQIKKHKYSDNYSLQQKQLNFQF